MRLILPALASAAAFLGACQAGEPFAPEPAAFASAPGAAVDGYYFPALDGAAIRDGDLVLDHLHIASGFELEAWEAGERPDYVYAPVMFEFIDETSPMVEGEIGGPSHSVRPRVLPTTYKLTMETFAFVGSGETTGPVSFRGTWDRVALDAADDMVGASEGPVLTGDLTWRGRTYTGVAFNYWVGD